MASLLLPSLPIADDDGGDRRSVLPSLPVFDYEEDDNDRPVPPPFSSQVFGGDGEEASDKEGEESDGEEFADHPDPAQLNVLSDLKLSRAQQLRLKSWSFLICPDKLDRQSWKLPYRDGLGRINRPLLARTREVLSSRTLAGELGIALDHATRMTALQLFNRAWPGQPCDNLLPAINAPVHLTAVAATTPVVIAAPLLSTEDLLAKGALLMSQSQRPEKRKAAIVAQAAMPSALQQVMVVSDAAPNLLMKLSSRQRRPVVGTMVGKPVAHTKLLELKLQAKQKLALQRERKSTIGRAVEEECRTPAPLLVQEVEEEEEEEEEAKNGEEEDEDDEDFVPEEEDEEEEEAEFGQNDSASEGKQQAVEEEDDEGEQPADEGSEGDNEEEEEANNKYRALLEADAQLVMDKSHRFVENQAEEEEEEEGQIRERVIGLNDYGQDGEEDEGDLRVTEADLKGIVDVAKDDTAAGRNQVLSLFQQQQEELDEKLENKLTKDLKNHTLIQSRKRMHANKLDKTLMDNDSGEETDEEQEMAKMLRFERETQSALDALQELGSGGGGSADQRDEEEEEILRELEQAKGFHKRALSLKRQQSAQSTTSSARSFATYSSQMLEQDEDTKAVWESLSQPTCSFEHSNSVFRQDSCSSSSSMLKQLTSAARRGISSVGAGSGGGARGIASLSRAFVYTKANAGGDKERAAMGGDVEEETDAARTGFEPVPAHSNANKKRRVALKAVSVGALPISKLLEANRMGDRS
ncbi:hypothetical protein BASA81_004840 [Batrachochytrium salamandrivorans]|nr:hypothetical protein BASA81_004840 [Batrachochytrium salamandrivorans]